MQRPNATPTRSPRPNPATLRLVSFLAIADILFSDVSYRNDDNIWSLLNIFPHSQLSYVELDVSLSRFRCITKQNSWKSINPVFSITHKNNLNKVTRHS